MRPHMAPNRSWLRFFAIDFISGACYRVPVKIRKHKWLEKSLIQTNSVVFLEEYNKNLPVSFPKASLSALEEFHEKHPFLFKGGTDKWSMDKHRKRLMDWLSSRQHNV